MIYDWLIVFFNLRCLFINTFSPSVTVRRGVFCIMPVSPELEQALPRFVEAVQKSADVQDQLNLVSDLEQLKAIVNDVEPSLTGSALIPYEQATSPPKITIDSGILEKNIPWRLLRCPGGPLVLQMICEKVNFALWIESC
jgi:hypothetical protein